MRWLAEVHVRLRSGLADPEGQTIAGGLRSLGFDVDAVLTAAADCGIALEINCQVHRLDLGDTLARGARDRGIPLIISSDAHTTAEFDTLELGIGVARRAWLSPADVLNTRPLDALTPLLRRHRTSQS